MVLTVLFPEKKIDKKNPFSIKEEKKKEASSIIVHGNQDVLKDCGSVSNFTILNLPQNVKKEIRGHVHGMCVL